MLVTTDSGDKKIIAIFFFNIGRFIRALSSRFGPLPLLTILVGAPGGICYSLSGSDGYHNDVGTPPLSIASDTRHSSPHRPHQCRTLARSTALRTQSPVRSSARGIATLHVKGVLPLSFPQEVILTPTLREAFLVNKATTHRTMTVMAVVMEMQAEGAGRSPAIFLSVAASLLVCATAILSCCCLVDLSYTILVGVVFIYCFTS